MCVESGTLHAMTSGSLVYEIEYGSDYTYRFFDYNRQDERENTRELHIKEALQAIKIEMKSQPKPITEGRWISERDYEICRMTGLKSYKNQSNELECITVLQGKGTCAGCVIKDGITILLLPGENLGDIEFDAAIIARLRR